VLLHTPGACRSSEGGAFDDQIVRAPLDDGAVTNLVWTNGFPAAIAADAQSVYFVDQDGIKSVPIVGGVVRTLTAQVTSAQVVWRGIAIVGATVVVTASSKTGGSVYSVPTHHGSRFRVLAVCVTEHETIVMICGFLLGVQAKMIGQPFIPGDPNGWPRRLVAEMQRVHAMTDPGAGRALVKMHRIHGMTAPS
jgi:hypothetical protein